MAERQPSQVPIEFSSVQPVVVQDVPTVTAAATSHKAPMSIPTETFQDPWQHKRVHWTNVVLALMTYSLLFSDVPRAGTSPRLRNLRQINWGVYSLYGSLAYPVATFSRDPDNLTNLTATNGSHAIHHVNTWSYVHDTTSSGLRVVTRTRPLNLSQDDPAGTPTTTTNDVIRCMNYELRCDPRGLLPLQHTFEVLDQVIEAAHLIPDRELPEILPRPSVDTRLESSSSSSSSYYQYTRQASLVKRRHIDLLSEYLASGLVDSVDISSFRITHFPNINENFDPCARYRDRPYLCDAGSLFNFRVPADPLDAESVKIGRVSQAVRNQALATRKAFQSRTSNIQVDVTFLESFSHPLSFTGGAVVSASAAFEIVKLTRVRDCSRSETTCNTIYLEDYRFEGARVITNAMEWATVLAILRITGQTLFILRVIALLIGCYYAFPPDQRSWQRALFLFGSEVPSHVVLYGSPLPILLYTVAMWIDGPVTSLMVHHGGVRLKSTSIHSLVGLESFFHLICILMRRQWLMASLVMIWLKLQTLSNHWDRHTGIMGVRGHVFSVVSSLCMILGYSHPLFRDARVVDVTDANPDTAVLHIGMSTRDLVNQKFGGIVADVIALLVSAIAYVVGRWGLQVVVRLVSLWLFGKNTSAASSPKVVPRKTSQGRLVALLQKDVATKNGRLFCRTPSLPSTCGTIWSPLGLVCAWDGDVLLSALGQDQHSVVDSSPTHRQRTVMLMNIVQLTEPVNFMLLRLGLVDPEIHITPSSVVEAPVCDSTQASTSTTISARDLPFHELVQIG